MRVLFVKVPLTHGSSLGGFENSVLEPLEFEYLAGAIPHHEVRCLDLRREPAGALERNLQEFAPEIVASTANTVDVYAVQALFREVKTLSPTALTVVGGYHPTYRPEDFNNRDTDVIVQGQGEIAFREIVDTFERTRTGRDFSDIRGLMIPDRGRLLHTGTREPGPIDDVQPDRGIVRAYRKRYFCEYWMPTAMVRNTWGCPYRCSFCALWNLAGGKLWERDVERMCDELEEIEEKYIFFCDDLSFSLKSTGRIERFCSEMRRRDLRKEFYFTCRSDIVVRLPHLIEKLREVGLRRVFLGLEAHTDSGLDYWNKGSQAQTNEAAVRLLHSHGIDVTGSFLITPHFSKQQFEELFDYVDRLNILCPAFLIYTPHPGVHAHEANEFGPIHENYEFYDHLHTLFNTTLPLDEFYERFSGLWKAAYSPFCRTGYRRFWRVASRVSLPLLPHTIKLGFSIFRRMAKGNHVVDRYCEGDMSNSGRERLASVEAVAVSSLRTVSKIEDGSAT